MESTVSPSFREVLLAPNMPSAEKTSDIDWRLFDRGYAPLRRCSLCLYEAKFDAAASQSYYCGRLKQWTAVVFECPFWEAREEWTSWYAHCTLLQAQKRS